MKRSLHTLRGKDCESCDFDGSREDLGCWSKFEEEKFHWIICL